MKNNFPHSRGFTLLELMVTTAMLAVLTTATMVLVSTSYSAWNRHEEVQATRQAGIAVLRHIVRHVRQASSVVAISTAADNSGTLSILTPTGQTLVWDHDAGTKRVLFGVITANQVLATGIEELNFAGIRTDGVTLTTDVGLIHSIRATTEVSLVHPASTEAVTASCQAWLRAW
jgi:prepilin-type N-terminal cleavage/methylation domain-containing protein